MTRRFWRNLRQSSQMPAQPRALDRGGFAMSPGGAHTHTQGLLTFSKEAQTQQLSMFEKAKGSSTRSRWRGRARA